MNHLYDALFAADPAAPLLSVPDGDPLTYGAMDAWAARMAGALTRAGVRPGDRVAAQVEKSPAAFALWLGCLRAGAVFLPLNPAYTPAEFGYFLADAEPSLLVCDPARLDMLRVLAPGAVLTLDADGRGSMADAAAAAEPAPVVLRGADDLAAILYTSGTTGRSKGAMLSHGNLRSNFATLAQVWQVAAGDVLLHILPIFHVHGLFTAAGTLMLAGGSMLWLDRFDPAAVMAALPRATLMMGVPTYYTRLLERADFTACTAAGIRLFISGSAPLLEETHRRFAARTGQMILERYGMTETGMNTSNPVAGERRPGSVGLPLPGVDLRVTGAGRAPLPAGEVGMIEVRGPNVFQGYWRMPDKTAEELGPDGWFITGDLGRQDADGYVTIVGRGKDLVISGGLNVYPREVEAAIDALPGVAESAVIGVPHPDLGEAVVAVVVPEPGAAPQEAAILFALTGQLAGFKRPKRVILAPALPRNTMGKVQKSALRADHAGLFAGASDRP